MYGPNGASTTGLPHPVHHRFVDSQALGQRTNAPMGGVRRFGLSGRLDDQRGEAVSFVCLSPSTRSILFDLRQSLVNKPSAPARDLAPINPKSSAILWFSCPSDAINTILARFIKR